MLVAAGSGAKVAAATSFRYSFENRKNDEFNVACGAALRWEAAIDTGRKLAFLNIRSSHPTVILSADTMFVKASALPDWHIPTDWLAVPFANTDDLRNVDSSLGVALGPKFWSSQDTSNPTTALTAMKDTVSSVETRGDEQVRGIDTTRYDLAIDATKAGLWTGGTTTTTAAPAGPPSAAELRSRRESVLASMPGLTKDGLPEEAKQAFLDGDVGPMVDHAEHTSGTAMKPADRMFLEVLAAGDTDAMIRSAEASTGTTVDPAARKMIEGLGHIGTIPPDVARSRRQALLDSITKALPGSPAVPEDVKAAVLDGDVDALVGYVEHTTGSSVPPIARSTYQMQMSAQDITGALGSMFSAFTTIQASVWVDHDGLLRRLDERVDVASASNAKSSTGTSSKPSPPMADVRLEFWDVGVPIPDALPDPAAVTPVADLSRTEDIPTSLSPCDMRFPATTR